MEDLFNNLFFDNNELPEPVDDSIEFSTCINDKRYTTRVDTIHYTPNGPCPAISEIIDTTKYIDLVNEINASNVTDDEKMFLKLAAARQCIINFGKAANYYAYASKEMQELMEHNALVVIDFNDAVRNGFVMLDKRLDDLITAQLQAEKESEEVD